MGLVGSGCRQPWIGRPLGLIFAGATMSQFVPAENAINRANRWQRLNSKVFQFPENCLGTAEQVLVVKAQADQFDDLLNLLRSSFTVLGTS